MDEEFWQHLEAERASLPGWCSPEKARKLAETVLHFQPHVCVEIGVFGGSSLIPLALAIQRLGRGKVFGIDPWQTAAALEDVHDETNASWWGGVDLEEIYRTCRQRLQALQLESCCELLRARAEDVSGRFPEGTIGLLHIDGNHSESHSLRDAATYLPLLAPDGTVFFDDISWSEKSVPTTHRALAYFLERGCRLVDATGDCAILRKETAGTAAGVDPLSAPLACRWRERTPGGWLCRSAKFLAPPNPVDLDFCRSCCYREV